MDKQEFFKQMDEGTAFPVTEDQVLWWDQWMDLHPQQRKELEEKVNKVMHDQAAEWSCFQVFLRAFFEKHGEGWFQMGWKDGMIIILPPIHSEDRERFEYQITKKL